MQFSGKDFTNGKHGHRTDPQQSSLLWKFHNLSILLYTDQIFDHDYIDFLDFYKVEYIYVI